MGGTFIHEFLSIVCAGDLREAAKETVIVTEAHLLTVDTKKR